MLPDLHLAQKCVAERCGIAAFDTAVILGSGLGEVADQFLPAGEMSYDEIPGLPQVSTPGHSGQLAWSEGHAGNLLFFKGRFHLYQGLSVYDVVSPIVLAHALGCKKVLITNASGAVNPAYKAGDPIYVTDHINLSGESPLRGLNPPPFLDLCNLYQPLNYEQLRDSLVPLGVSLQKGVLAFMPGPTYETPAEIRLLRNLGADLVSMSMVHEAIVAHFLGLQVTGISIVANPAAGLSGRALDHVDVLNVSRSSIDILSLCLKSCFSVL